jgi:hypothetical protein
MTQEGFKRKLTAILSADAVGYSRLMGEDEEATVRTISFNLSFIFCTELQPKHVDVHAIPHLITGKILSNKEIEGDTRKFREPGTLCRYRP